MATSINLQSSINFAKPYLKNQDPQVSLMEPALTAANIVLQSMIGPPCRWRFNRGELNFSVSSAGTDYKQSVPTFGFVEAAWLVDGSGNQYEMKGAVVLSVNGAQARPERIAPQFDDNAGNVTFRLDKTPDQTYTAYVDFQQNAVLLSSPASFWAPVADEFGFIYHYGFLALVSLLVNDARFPIFENYFISRLLAAQDGLDAQARDIFLADCTTRIATLERAKGSVQAGLAGRTR